MGLVAMKCPSCGADIQLDDSREFGFCNFCGTKVMQEKIVVEHQGSVKVDNSEFVEKQLQNAHRALQKEDWEEVERYYNLVEQNAPDNMEAVFFSAYGKAMLSLTDNDFYKREQKIKVLNKSISVISDYFETTNEDKEAVIRMIAKYAEKFAYADFVYNTGGNNGGARARCLQMNRSVYKAFKQELREISMKHRDAYILELLNKETAFEAEERNVEVKATIIGSFLRFVPGLLFISIGFFAVAGSFADFEELFFLLLIGIALIGLGFWFLSLAKKRNKAGKNTADVVNELKSIFKNK